MHRIAYVLYGVIMASSIAIFLLQTTTATSSTWLTSPLERRFVRYVQNTIVHNPEGCQPHDFMAYSTVMTDFGGKRQLHSDCWVYEGQGGYGVSGGVTYIQPIGFSAAMRTSFYDGVQVLAGDRLIRKTTSGLIVYENARDAVETVKYNGGVYLQHKDDAKSWTPTRLGSNEAGWVGSYGISNNRKYLVLEQGHGFVRVDLDTKDQLSFVSPKLRYGVGLDPSYKYAISDDGRFVAILGTSGENQYVWLYDLATCKSKKTGIVIVEGCMEREIKNDLIGKNLKDRVSGIRFSGGGDMMYYYLYEDNGWKEYFLKPSGIEEHYLEYLALGDSYSSGEGDGDDSYYLPGTNGDGDKVESYQTNIDGFPYSVEKCHNSSRSYPYLLAQNAQLGKDAMRSVACSGAITNDITNVNILLADLTNINEVFNGRFEQLKNITATAHNLVKKKAVSDFALGRTAQIEFVRKYRPRTVTIGIGGNDMKFADLLMGCVIDKDKTCDAASTDRYKHAARIQNDVYDKVFKTYVDLKLASPTTKVYAVGYPQLFTTRATCDINAQLDFDERVFAMMTISYLNNILEAAARQVGIPFLDIEDSLDGTNLCSGEEYPTMNGLTAGDDIFGFIGNESYHPNEKGHKRIADKIASLLRDQPINTFDLCASEGDGMLCVPKTIERPPIPQYFLYGSRDGSTAAMSRIITSVDRVKSAFLEQFSTIKVETDAIFKPQTSVEARIFSDPINIGTFQVNANGVVQTEITIPHELPLGMHELHLRGVDLAGGSVEIFESFFVLSSPNDIDGDGITNSLDTCQFGKVGNQDIDKDGIDDACDGRVTPSPEEVTDVTANNNTHNTTPHPPVSIPSTIVYAGPIAAQPSDMQIPVAMQAESSNRSESNDPNVSMIHPNMAPSTTTMSQIVSEDYSVKRLALSTIQIIIPVMIVGTLAILSVKYLWLSRRGRIIKP